MYSIKYTWCLAVLQKKKEIYLHFSSEPGTQALICSRASNATEAQVRVERLLSGCEGCYPREGRHHSGPSIISFSHLGSFTESICKNQSWGKGEVCSDNPNTQKVLCCRELVNFFTNKGKKNLSPSWGGLQAWQPPTLCVLIVMWRCLVRYMGDLG